jgi:hypothetical protein
MNKSLILKIACALYICFWLFISYYFVKNRNDHEITVLSELLAQTKSYRESGFFTYPPQGETLTKRGVVKSVYIKRGMEDKKTVALQIFLTNYNSPMADYAQVFVEEAERYGFDWRLSPSIAMLETAAGRLAPKNKNGEITYNAWGWREGGDWKKFSSWEDGIRYVAHRLAYGYGVKNLNPKTMEPTYCQSCHEAAPGKWAEGVTKYMNEIQSIYNNL